MHFEHIILLLMTQRTCCHAQTAWEPLALLVPPLVGFVSHVVFLELKAGGTQKVTSHNPITMVRSSSGPIQIKRLLCSLLSLEPRAQSSTSRCCSQKSRNTTIFFAQSLLFVDAKGSHAL